jgi:hypothetical protein
VVVVFALLLWQNFALRRLQAHAAAAGRSRAFAVHDSIEPLPIVDLNGARSTFQFDRRTVVAIVDPRCDSCRKLLAQIRPDTGVQVLSVAPLAETRAMAQSTGLTAVTHALGQPLPARNELQLSIYPQLFVVDGGQVVRTCASVNECAGL